MNRSSNSPHQPPLADHMHSAASQNPNASYTTYPTYQQGAPPMFHVQQHPSMLTQLPPLSATVLAPSLASLPPISSAPNYQNVASHASSPYLQQHPVVSSSSNPAAAYSNSPFPAPSTAPPPTTNHDPSAYAVHSPNPATIASPSPNDPLPVSPSLSKNSALNGSLSNSVNPSNGTGKGTTSPPGVSNSSLVKRQARKRTKTGCLTCRKRRIKCDERKPICYNCIKSKRQCEGYTHFPRPTGALTAARRIPVSSLLSEPAPHGMAGQPTHPTFLYYIQSVAPSLCLWDSCYFPPLSPYSSFSSIYWSSTIPELALRNPNISVALYAFASAKRHLTDDAIAFSRQARVTLTNITTTESLLILVLLAVTQLYIPKCDIQLFNFAVDQVVKFDASLMTSPSDEIITYLLRRMFIRQVVLAGIVRPLHPEMSSLALLKAELPPATTPTAVLDESLFNLGLRSLCHEPGLEPEFSNWYNNCPVDKADLPRLALLMIHAVFVSPNSLAQWVEFILHHPDPTPAIHIARACLLAVRSVMNLSELQVKVDKCVKSCEEKQLQASISNFSQDAVHANSSSLSIGV
ncbi:DNA-binding transcription factor, zf-fungal binuclear cluster type Gsf1 [Schizosaccharomyces osmophilus]|uniref:DNA-binding transcription factor, zf-fungal binuclear cluster type Gsf1 n=1 Tax=Schizosaccharomyces osmophilus TaxID=2545709 RepID=A0AAE9WBL0_9SCHI|nr:DNA-binding transcription factor, zf-fungal binuclear cluster type Gsf1 [Schizosaccharomyces osmophilus]WBW71648.1 DNA-binding transcription factor, zf-fungal binuclear cluster type Gsf1 [Schizosaccharomyces osmophilus]